MRVERFQDKPDPINAEGLREGPKDARIQNEAFGSVRIDGQVVQNLAAKPSVLIVDGVLQPERKNVRK